MLLFLIDSSGNLIYEGQHKHYLEQDTDQHHHHDSRSLRFLPLMAAQSVLEEEFGNERISGVKLADGSTAAFYQVQYGLFYAAFLITDN
jgi:hypothetical protein